MLEIEGTNEYYTFSEYMRKNKLTPSEEDYIESIYRISIKKENITVNDVSENLNITPASVSKMIKKLDKKDVLQYEKYGNIKLTKRGYIIGKKLLHRHNVVNEFLKIIGVRKNLHEETEKIEHTIDIDTLAKIEILTKFLKEDKEVLNKFIEFSKSYDD